MSPTRMRAQTSRNMHLIDAQDELARTDSGDNEMAFKLNIEPDEFTELVRRWPHGSNQLSDRDQFITGLHLMFGP